MTKEKRNLVIIFIVLIIVLLAVLFFIAPNLRENSSDNGDTSSEPVNPIAKIKETMTDEQKAGQLILARVPDVNQIEDIQNYGLGGYLIFGRDVEGETTDTFTSKVNSWQEASTVPMIIASDEEGGTVTRVSTILPQPFPGPGDLYASGGLDAVIADAQSKSETLKSLGINVNLAPVADVAVNPNSFIYERTLKLPIETDLAQAAQITSDYVVGVVGAMKTAGIGCSLKHFPGYGENGDSHTDIITDPRELDVLESVDFLPFKAGIDAGAGSVLISHNIAVAIDPNQPASLSPEVHRILRENLGFHGVILTDDFDMAGLAQFVDQNTGAIQTINAGTDLIISSSYSTQIPAIVEAVNNGQIPRERFEEAVDHVLQWKYDLGIINDTNS